MSKEKLPAAFLISTLALGSSACGGAESPPQPTQSSSISTTHTPVERHLREVEIEFPFTWVDQPNGETCSIDMTYSVDENSHVHTLDGSKPSGTACADDTEILPGQLSNNYNEQMAILRHNLAKILQQGQSLADKFDINTATPQVADASTWVWRLGARTSNKRSNSQINYDQDKCVIEAGDGKIFDRNIEFVSAGRLDLGKTEAEVGIVTDGNPHGSGCRTNDIVVLDIGKNTTSSQI